MPHLLNNQPKIVPAQIENLPGSGACALYRTLDIASCQKKCWTGYSAINLASQLYQNRGTCCTAEWPYCLFPILCYGYEKWSLIIHPNFTSGDPRVCLIQICIGILGGKRARTYNFVYFKYYAVFINIVVSPCTNKVICDEFRLQVVYESEFRIV